MYYIPPPLSNFITFEMNKKAFILNYYGMLCLCDDLIMSYRELVMPYINLKNYDLQWKLNINS